MKFIAQGYEMTTNYEHFKKKNYKEWLDIGHLLEFWKKNQSKIPVWVVCKYTHHRNEVGTIDCACPILESTLAQSPVPVQSPRWCRHSRLCPFDYRINAGTVVCACSENKMMRVQWAMPKYFHLYCRDSGLYSYALASDWRTQLEKYTIATICFKEAS